MITYSAHGRLLTSISAQLGLSTAHRSQDVAQEEQMSLVQEPQQAQHQMDASITTNDLRGSVISEEDIKELDERISELSSVRTSDDRALAENIRQKLDHSLLNCWLKLGLTVEEDELFSTVPGKYEIFSYEPQANIIGVSDYQADVDPSIRDGTNDDVSSHNKPTNTHKGY